MLDIMYMHSLVSACVRVCVHERARACSCAYLDSLGLGVLQRLHQLHVVQHVALRRRQFSQQRVLQVFQQPFVVAAVWKNIMNRSSAFYGIYRGKGGAEVGWGGAGVWVSLAVG